MKFKKVENNGPKRTKPDPKQGVQIKVERPQFKEKEQDMQFTLNNIHALTVLQLKIFGRLGFQIKVMEEVRDELRKLVDLVEKQ